ncbi:MAG: hypothetical protein PT939_04925 [Aerococcus suis]|nr:hypothetical protein [Aerococcus suis]
MHVDIVALGTIISIIIGLITIAKFIVGPFNTALKRNDEIMKNLQKSVDKLSYELRDSQKDRESIHKILDSYGARIGRNEDELITHRERINTLFRKKSDK